MDFLVYCSILAHYIFFQIFSPFSFFSVFCLYSFFFTFAFFIIVFFFFVFCFKSTGGLLFFMLVLIINIINMWVTIIIQLGSCKVIVDIVYKSKQSGTKQYFKQGGSSSWYWHHGGGWVFFHKTYKEVSGTKRWVSCELTSLPESILWCFSCNILKTCR